MKYIFPLRIWFRVATLLVILMCSGTLSAAEVEGPPASKQELSIANASVDQESSPAIIDRIITVVASWLAILGVAPEGVKLYAPWIVGAPAFVVLVLIIIFFRPRSKEKKRQRNLKTGKALGIKSSSINSSQIELISGDSALTDKQKVLKFFFNLFKKQINADSNTPTELFLVETRPTCPNESYEMRVLQNGEWIVRRMSIGLLGQGGGSRSKCYYVIYDSHMVIKLPAEPITQFLSYNRQIAAEASIVARLQPRECIVPRVSVILESVHKIPYSHELSPEAVEKKYVHLLEVKPAFQEYVKISGSFAFFMDLAKHFFLSNTLEEIHHGHISLAQEAIQHPDLLWDQNGFVGRYGEEAGAVCHVLREAYYRCESKLETLVEEAAIIDDVPLFRLKQWFLIHLAGEQLHPKKEDLPEGLIYKANELLRNVIAANQEEVNRYRIGVNAYIRDIRFSQHRNQLEGLSTNTLDLLAWLGKNGLALRDLKPENLFVAGNPDEYPLFLGNPDKFSIGLIDVETAVAIDHKDKSKTPQPQLAGTPLYATPSHLFSNSILNEIYDDFQMILHLQDWYATIAILFKVITGENLFINTAGSFPEILRRLKIIDPAGQTLDADVGSINQIFWNSAAAELREALQKHLSLFLQVEVKVPSAFVPLIIKALHHESNQLARATARIVEDQKLFTSLEKSNFLRRASAEKIHHMKNKLLHEIEANPKPNHQKMEVLSLLDSLENHKARLQRKLEAAAALKAAESPIASDQLLEAMFQHVFSIMYLPHWPALQPSKFENSAHLPLDLATYQATMAPEYT